MTVSKGFLLGKLLPQFVTESLDSNGSLVAVAGGGADLSTLDITDVVGTDGDPGDLLQSLGNGNVAWQPNVSLSYEFKIQYAGATIDSAQELPAGWTLDSQDINTLWISHNTGRIPKQVSFLVNNGSSVTLQSGDDSCLTVSSILEAKNSFVLVADTSRTGAADSSLGYVNIVF
jgi:hypothetical protein